MQGKVVQISTKVKTPGEVGLPKHAVDSATVTIMGVGDDYNNYRMESKHGTKDRAVLLYTRDMIDTLNQEGWPLDNGHIGENFTLDGIKYHDLTLGTKLQVGEVKMEVAEICNPCNNLSALEYVGKEKIKEFIQTMKGRRGWYCRVLQEGTVYTGDTVELLN